MSQRLQDTTKWFWCALILYAGPMWNPVTSVTVRNPPNTPATVEAQAKFFQYRHLPTSEDFDQGHRLGSERHFTERHERARPSEGLFSAKVRWGDKQGGYGEHYWDLNHAGHAGNHGDDRYGSDSDDGSYRVHDNEDPYDEPSEQSNKYDNEYNPDKSSYYDDIGRSKRDPENVSYEEGRSKKDPENSNYEDNTSRRDPEDSSEEVNRAKRAHSRVKAEKKEEEAFEDIPKLKPKYKNNRKEQQPAASRTIETTTEKEPEETHKKPAKPKLKHRPVLKEQDFEEDNLQETYRDYQQPRELARQVETEAKEAENQEQVSQPSQYVSRRQPEHFVPYEGGAGVRQHQHPDVAAAASIPRLFLEPSTGHVIDRATGQAYILQPIVANNNYNIN